jgi:hypothetical protein
MYAFELAFNVGDSKALRRAVEVCGGEKKPLPAWAERAVLALIDQGQRPKGVPAKLDAHLTRWALVAELRDRSEELKDKGYKPTWEAAFENVSKKLRGTKARGSPGTIKKSYRKVQRLIKSGWGPVLP